MRTIFEKKRYNERVKKMKHTTYLITVLLGVLFLGGCDKSDSPVVGEELQQFEGVALQLGETELSAEATMRAKVGGVDYAVNTSEDPTLNANLISKRSGWKLDFSLYNGKNASGSVDATPYADASFTAGVYNSGTSSWIPNPDRQLYFPNYFKPHVEAWLYPSTKDAAVETDQSTEEKLLVQDILHRAKSVLPGNTTEPFGKKLSIQLSHQRAMLNFKFQDIAREDIDEASVRVFVGSTGYQPYKVRESGVLEFLLILPENTKIDATNKMIISYNTKENNPIEQSIHYKQEVALNNGNELGSNNCYCFTLSGKELKISPVTIVNWVTGEPVSGEYVAVTAYPTFKGPNNKTFYFYYDNQLTEDGSLDGTPKLQEINFNNDGECTIKPDGRIITHIFKNDSPSEADWTAYGLQDPIILGNAEKMYINLLDKNIQAFED